MTELSFFTMQMLNKALKNVKSPEDTQELSTIILKLTNGSMYEDPHLLKAQRDILVILINHELNTASDPSFQNLYGKIKEPHTRDLPALKEYPQIMTQEMLTDIFAELDCRLNMFRYFDRFEATPGKQ